MSVVQNHVFEWIGTFLQDFISVYFLHCASEMYFPEMLCIKEPQNTDNVQHNISLMKKTHFDVN
jgi:hypothetical protein